MLFDNHLGADLLLESNQDPPAVIQVDDLPPGLSATIRSDPRPANGAVHGSYYVRLFGTPVEAGDYDVDVQLQDLQGFVADFSFLLPVTVPCGTDRDGDGIDDCLDSCLDADGDGFGRTGGAGNSCLGSDCNDENAATFPGAAETHDGEDNQCPGEGGFGLIDEISGTAGFNMPLDPFTFSWPAQPGATGYEVARSGRPDFLQECR